MNSYYQVIADIEEILKDEPFINSVTYGDPDVIETVKQADHPIAHVIPGQAQIADRVIILNISIILMDIVDYVKEGPNNEQDVLNTMLSVAARFDAEIKRRGIYKDKYELQGSINCEPFNERFENNLAGWALTFSMALKNDMTSC